MYYVIIHYIHSTQGFLKTILKSKTNLTDRNTYKTTFDKVLAMSTLRGFQSKHKQVTIKLKGIPIRVNGEVGTLLCNDCLVDHVVVQVQPVSTSQSMGADTDDEGADTAGREVESHDTINTQQCISPLLRHSPTMVWNTHLTGLKSCFCEIHTVFFNAN